MADFNVVGSAMADYFRTILWPAAIGEFLVAVADVSGARDLRTDVIVQVACEVQEQVADAVSVGVGLGPRAERSSGASSARELRFESLLHDFDQAIEIVLAAISRQADADWSAPYSAEREPGSRNRFTVFLRCAGHAHHHVGQIIYLQRERLENCE